MNTTSSLSDVTRTTLPSIEMEFEMKLAKKMHFWTSSLIGTLLVVVGLTGNLLSIIIWKRKKMTSSTGTYLIGQAIADIGLLVFFFLTDSLPMMIPEIQNMHEYAVFYCYIGFPLFFWSILLSIWVTVGVTFDRFVLVCWLSRAQTMCTNKQAVVTMVITAVFCLIANGPHFFTFRPITVEEMDDNSTTIAYTETEYGGGLGSRMYEFWVHCMFMVLCPWALVFTLNVNIIHKIGRQNRQVAGSISKSSRDRRRKSEAQMTYLLLTVTFTFLFLLAFQCVTQCFFMLQKGNTHIVSEAFSIAKLGVVINSSVNFYLYCLSGKRFRKELRQLMTCCPWPSCISLRPDRAMTLTSDSSSTTFTAQRGSSSSVESYKEVSPATVNYVKDRVDHQKGTVEYINSNINVSYQEKLPLPPYQDTFTHL